MEAVDVPVEQGSGRSRSWRHRLDFGRADGVEIRSDGGEPVAVPSLGEVAIEAAAFTADGSRLFAAGMAPDVHVIDPSSAAVIDTVPDVAGRVTGLAVSPDGGSLVTAGPPADVPWSDDEVRVHRLADLAWSPDGRWVAMNLEHAHGGGEVRTMSAGLPARPPAELRAPAAA
ncbi:WD40 repeat domain-containing protein [Marinitenerispora sediminis]|uniref:Lipoprotein LpqB beta-propeller domain-containing protein n=1 Tax=Marinitenerispora sediminis TaxID=1931232 RepID=A0A368T821_9ACTN|nr:PD40 domain-containing protein [Marinitenerispora sediminis]RCV47888.1 hypothetical protein DEF28_25055 [Marinitenerispora sediminis]RCV48670.1 hypothetical protein DEF23_24725 [Marinitenerispora sediminis]RCV60436.1 hypothetical protein DEF24_07075 [Marinitenerispora sediminis]